MSLLKTIKNHVMLLLLYINSLVNGLKIKLGLLNEKYGIMGYFQLKGISFSGILQSQEVLEACQKFDKFRPDDVILATYPKAGTHFTGEIICSIYKEKGLIAKGDFHSIMGTLDFTPPSVSSGGNNSDPLAHVEKISSPRILMMHLPLDFLPPKAKEGNVKIIHCMRNPKDVVCSFYPFLNKVRVLMPDLTWKEFVMNFISGNVLYGSYMNYMKKWYPYRNMPSVLNLQFEEMKEDLEGNVRRIAKFLEIELTDAQICRVTVANTFENKKREVGKGHIIYRTGKSGGWRSDITVEQNDMMDEWISAEMKDMPDLKLKYGDLENHKQ